jgi:hypothetical protein
MLCYDGRSLRIFYDIFYNDSESAMTSMTHSLCYDGFFPNVETENGVATTDERASEMMQSLEETKRPRYSEKLYHFALTLANYSVTGYQLLRKVIPLPNLPSLHSKFRNVVKVRDQPSCVDNHQALLTNLLEMDECGPPRSSWQWMLFRSRTHLWASVA